jgi:hypothetical protein
MLDSSGKISTIAVLLMKVEDMPDSQISFLDDLNCGRWWGRLLLCTNLLALLVCVVRGDWRGGGWEVRWHVFICVGGLAG